MRYVYCLFLLLSFAAAYTQQNIAHFTSVNGLPHDITYGIFQDREGYIWIGTDDGLVRYDGQEFQSFSVDDGLRNNFVIDVNQDNDGTIVVATWGGGLHFIRDGKVLPVIIANDSDEKLNNLQIWGNSILVKHTSGNILYEKSKSGYVKKLLASRDNILFKEKYAISTGKYYMTVIDDTAYIINDIKSFYHNANLVKKGIHQVKGNSVIPFAGYFDKKTVNSISKISSGKFAVTVKDTLFVWQKSGPVKIRKLRLDSDTDYITKVEKIGSDTFLVLASNAKGFKNAFLFSDDFRRRTDLKKQLGITTAISDFLVDNEKNIWITTNGEGVYCYSKNIPTFKNISKKLPETLILDIAEFEGTNYILSPNYLTSVKDPLHIQPVKLNGIGKKITRIKDSLLVTSVILTHGIRKGKIREVTGFNIISRPGQPLVYISDSVRIGNSNKRFYNKKRVVYDAVYFRDTLWFATNVGMFYYDRDQSDLVRKTIGNKKLLSEHIRKFIINRDVLWIATNKGLCRFGRSQMTCFTKKDGLINAQINCMLQDHSGKLWIGTNRGISVFDGKNFINLTTGRGLLSPFINVIFENSKNEILVGSDKGVTIIDNTRPLQLEKAPILNISQEGTKFGYAALSYNRCNSLVTEYRLGQSGWNPLPGPIGALDFKKERKGTYSIQFRAKKQDGVWGYSKKYTFKITLPWYKDFAYVAALLSVVSALVIFLILNQLQKVKKRNQVLKLAIERQKQLENELSEVRHNIAQDFHDELGNKLARISLFSNLALNEVSHEDEKLKSKIMQIENDANHLYKGTKDFIFSLKEESNYLEELVTYLSDFGEEFFRNSDIRFIVEKEIESNIRLPYYWSKQLIYIFKEALTNALKHSHCNKIIFSFTYAKGVLKISCHDNGNGYSGSRTAALSGINNMYSRARKLNGNLLIDFTANQGTTVTFTGKTT